MLRKDAKFQALVGRLSGGGAWLMLPQSFMNASGRPVQMLASFFKIAAAEILVVHDEVDFPPGVARLKLGGGIAGHNGLKDISQRLATHEYWRLRLGIGHPGDKDAVAEYVLSRPTAEEREAIDGAIARALEVMPQVLAGDMQAAMQKLHTDGGRTRKAGAEAPQKPAETAARTGMEPAPAAPQEPATSSPAAPPAPAAGKEPGPQPAGKWKGLLGSLFHPGRRK